MGRPKRDRVEMYHQMIDLSYKIRSLQGIIQNDHAPCDEELMEWVDLVHDNINELNSLKEDIIRYYQD